MPDVARADQTAGICIFTPVIHNPCADWILQYVIDGLSQCAMRVFTRPIDMVIRSWLPDIATVEHVIKHIAAFAFPVIVAREPIARIGQAMDQHMDMIRHEDIHDALACILHASVTQHLDQRIDGLARGKDATTIQGSGNQMDVLVANIGIFSESR